MLAGNYKTPSDYSQLEMTLCSGTDKRTDASRSVGWSSASDGGRLADTVVELQTETLKD